MYDLYLAEQYLKTLKTWIAFNVFYIVFAIGVYVLFAYLLMLRGRKAGVSTDWQAYVPFARELYKMKMLDVRQRTAARQYDRFGGQGYRVLSWHARKQI